MSEDIPLEFMQVWSIIGLAYPNYAKENGAEAMAKTLRLYYRMLKDIAKKTGIPGFHPHLLRHSRIRHLLDSGMPLERVSEVAGHRKLDTTLKIYGSLRATERARYLDEVAPW